MKYSEFEKEVKEWAITYGIPLDYTQYDYDNIILSNEINGNRIAIIEWNTQYCFDMNWGGTDDLSDPAKRDLFDLLVAISETVPKDRLEYKYYHLEHKFIGSSYWPSYLEKASDRLILSTFPDLSCKAKLFTLDEIEEIKKKFNTSLEDFEIIEVENERNKI